MSQQAEQWLVEKCPACGSRNWYQDDLDDDPSKMDVSSYTCWQCGHYVELFDDEDGVEYRPHIQDTGKYDYLSHGTCVDGQRCPR